MNEKSNPKRHKREQFTTEEDLKLVKLIQKFGTSNWKFISSQMGKRTVRQCKDRWENYLSPSLNKNPWTDEENSLLIKKYRELGSRWKEIATFFTNRTQINVRNQVLRLIKEGKCSTTSSNQNQEKEISTNSEQNSNLTTESEISPLIPSNLTSPINRVENENHKTLRIPPPNVISPNTIFPTFPFTSSDGKLLTIEHNSPMIQAIKDVPEYSIKEVYKDQNEEEQHEISIGYMAEATRATFPIISEIIAKSSETPDVDDHQEF